MDLITSISLPLSTWVVIGFLVRGGRRRLRVVQYARHVMLKSYHDDNHAHPQGRMRQRITARSVRCIGVTAM